MERAVASPTWFQAPLGPLLYSLSADGLAIFCRRCARVSRHPTDIAERYCGHCHVFLSPTSGHPQGVQGCTIFWNASDHPDRFAVRAFRIIGNRVHVGPLLGAPLALEDARALVPPGLVRFDRSPGDDACIVETWL